MTIHPDIQLRAQEELDSLTSGERLPTIHDRSKLPYVNAIVLETLRWGPSGSAFFLIYRVITRTDVQSDVQFPQVLCNRCRPSYGQVIDACAGLPHRLAENDEYRGYRIPANSVVYANTWHGLTHHVSTVTNVDY